MIILILLISLAFSATAAYAAAPEKVEEATVEVSGCTEIIGGVRTPCVIEEIASPYGEFPMSEEEEKEAEEIEAEAREESGAGGVPAADASACSIRRLGAQVTALPESGRLQLTLRYATSEPTAVSVGLKARDGKGAMRLPSSARRLGRGGGTLRVAVGVGSQLMGRIAKASEIAVSLRPVNAPPGCGAPEQKLRRDYSGTTVANQPAASGTVAGSIVWTTGDSR